MTYILVYLTFVVSLFAISFANGNYGYLQQVGSAPCDRGTYDRAQNSMRIEIQQQTPRLQPPYDSSISSGMTNGYQANSQYGGQQNENQCR